MKPKLTPRGRRILQKALKVMVAHADTFNMRTWYYHDKDVEPTKGRPEPYCGTEACLAGHIVLAAGEQVRTSTDVPTRAIRLLFGNTRNAALREEQENLAWNMFSTRRWPYKLSSAYLLARTHKQQVRVAVQRVQHWLRTGE